VCGQCPSGSAHQRWAVVGYGILWHAADEAELADLAVHPAFRRSGVGVSLLDRFVEEAHGAGVQAIFLKFESRIMRRWLSTWEGVSVGYGFADTITISRWRMR
jgi:ribosomal protein S18 acetylase RimI-like enzyme